MYNGMDEGQQDLVFCILDKNLKTRTGADLINKAIAGCVPTFKVALANSYDKQKSKVDFNDTNVVRFPKVRWC